MLVVYLFLSLSALLYLCIWYNSNSSKWFLPAWCYA